MSNIKRIHGTQAVRRSLARELWASLTMLRQSREIFKRSPSEIMRLYCVAAKSQLDGQRLMVIRLTQDGVI